MPKSFTTPRRKATIVGAGFVGSTAAFSLMAANVVDEIALVDINDKLAESQAMDLQHSMPFWGSCDVYHGTYEDIADSCVVVIACGANQKPGETRIDLVKKNAAIMQEVVPRVFKANPNVILVMVTNPVDVLTYQAIKMFPNKRKQIMGTGTILDSARLRYLIGSHFKVNPQSVHAYIMGEHGDSEFAAWSTATIGNVKLTDFPGYEQRHMDKLFSIAKNAAYTIIEGKQATYYAIGAGVARLVQAILGDDRTVLPVSSLVDNYHNISEVCLSVPTIIGRTGVQDHLKLKLNAAELKQLKTSATRLKEVNKTL